MAILPITEDNLDLVTLQLKPKKQFISSSAGGVTGSVRVLPEHSDANKQWYEFDPASNTNQFKSDSLEEFRDSAFSFIKGYDLINEFYTYNPATNSTSLYSGGGGWRQVAGMSPMPGPTNKRLVWYQQFNRTTHQNPVTNQPAGENYKPFFSPIHMGKYFYTLRSDDGTFYNWTSTVAQNSPANESGLVPKAEGGSKFTDPENTKLGKNFIDQAYFSPGTQNSFLGFVDGYNTNTLTRIGPRQNSKNFYFAVSRNYPAARYDNNFTLSPKFTMAFWIKRYGDNYSGVNENRQVLFQWWHPDTDDAIDNPFIELSLLRHSATETKIQFRSNWTVETAIWTTDEVYEITGKWAHVAVSYDYHYKGNNPDIYLNGEKLTISRAGPTNLNYIRPSLAPNGVHGKTSFFNHGDNVPNQKPSFHGWCAEIAIWRGILTRSNIRAIYEGAILGLKTTSNPNFSNYLTKVNKQRQSLEQNKKLEIIRFEPSINFSSNTMRKLLTVNNLYSFYRGRGYQADFSYTNYHCLNFFTGSTSLTSSAIVYPAPSVRNTTNQYISTDGFTFAFYINPKRTIPQTTLEYSAGTIMHLSSAFAISVVTGSSKNEFGFPDSFRIMLQLSHSADVSPDKVDLGIANGQRDYPQDLIFLSDDNLKLNNWSHISMAWSPSRNSKTGSFYIDGVKNKAFVVSSGSINTAHSGYTGNPSFCPLIIGNYYNSNNGGGGGGSLTTLNRLFNKKQAELGGTEIHAPAEISDPPASIFTNHLNAEIHDLRIYDNYISNQQIVTASMQGPSTFKENGLIFYLPPFFTKNSPKRNNILQSTFRYLNQKSPMSSSTMQPYNVRLSYNVGGKNINLENFTMDMCNNLHPRLFHLSASVITETTVAASANTLLYEHGIQSSYVRARNLMCLPCDNGLFKPNFKLLLSESAAIYSGRPDEMIIPNSGSSEDRFVNDYGYLDLSKITLRNMISNIEFFNTEIRVGTEEWENLIDSVPVDDEEPDAPVSANDSTIVFYKRSGGPRPYEYQPTLFPTGLVGKIRDNNQILYKTRDNTSDEIVIFDISNLFYGNYITPKSFSIVDKNLSGSDGMVSMKIKDNGFGGLYRADCESPQATWNSVGTILYDEGLAVIQSPNIPFFGKDQFEVNLEGNQNVHTMEVNVVATAGAINSSSNHTFNTKAVPSSYVHDTDKNFVSISGLAFHDENLNVISRTNLAQPVVKRMSDKFLFRIKIDF